MGLLEIIFPGICPVCGKPVEVQRVCEECKNHFAAIAKPTKKSIERNGKTYDLYGLYDYSDDFVKNYIFTLKRNAKSGLFDFAARDIVKNLLYLQGNKSFTLCYAPRSKTNTRLYGYDHAKCISKKMSKLFPHAEFCALLKRRGFSQEQKYLNAQQRTENVKNKFKLRSCDKLNNTFVIFDDISTTSSTFLSCASTIHNTYPDAKIIGVFICLN